jgi:hypothetical protein
VSAEADETARWNERASSVRLKSPTSRPMPAALAKVELDLVEAIRSRDPATALFLASTLA